MSKKKILAGLLSLTMAASLAPMNVLADAETGRSFRNAWGDVINQNECLYYEDFEGDTGSDFAISEDIQSRGYWHSAVTEKDGNKTMRYYATPKVVTGQDEEGNNVYIDFDADGGAKLLDNKSILAATSEINNNSWYEIGYQYYPDTMQGYFRTDFLTVKLADKESFMTKSHNNSNMTDVISFRSDVVAQKYTRDGKPIDLRAIINAATGEVRTYALQNGSTNLAWNRREYFTRNVSYKNVESGDIKIKMGITSAPSLDKITNDEPDYRIDNFYVRKLVHDTPTVTFVNGDVETPVKADYFKEAAIPADRPTKDGYIFIGWYNGNTRVDGTDEKPVTKLTNVTEDMTITAKWVQHSVVTFDSNGGSAVEPIETETGSITLPERPIKEGYSFMGWYKDNGTFERPFDGTDVEESVTVYARWDEYLVKEDFESYTSGLFDIAPAITAKGYWHSAVVDDGTGNKYMKYYITPDKTYDSTDGANLINREILASTEAINKDGWYEIGYTFYPNDIRANMSRFFSVFMGENRIVSGIRVRKASNMNQNLCDAATNYSRIVKDGLWSVNGPIYVKTIFDAGNNKERTSFTYAETGETIIIDSWSGENNTMLGNAKVGDSANIMIKMSCEEDPAITAKNNKTEMAAEPSFMIDDVYVKELNTATPTVTFINGADVTTQKVNYFNEVELPTPTKENFTFVGWFTEADEEFTGKNITSDVTVYAKWSGTYNVTFNANGGKFADESKTKSIDVDSETKAAIDEEPTRDGYKFCGWFTDSSCVTEFTGTVYENTTVYARWQTTPTIVSVTPENGSTGIELKPEIAITFDSEIDDTTLTKDNIMVLKDGTALSESLYNITPSLNAQRKTVVKITFTTELEASKEYTIKVSKAVKNQHSELADDYTSSFTTKSLKLNVEKISVKSGDTEVTDLSAVKGQKIKVTLRLTNAAGVGYTTIYSFRNGNALVSAHSPENTITGETVESELTVPENAQSLDLIVLDGLSTLKPLTGKTSIIE